MAQKKWLRFDWQTPAGLDHKIIVKHRPEDGSIEYVKEEWKGAPGGSGAHVIPERSDQFHYDHHQKPKEYFESGTRLTGVIDAVAGTTVLMTAIQSPVQLLPAAPQVANFSTYRVQAGSVDFIYLFTDRAGPVVYAGNNPVLRVDALPAGSPA